MGKVEKLEAAARGRQVAQGERGREGGRGNKKPLDKQLSEGKPKPHARDVDTIRARTAGTNRQYIQDAKTIAEKRQEERVAAIAREAA